MQQTGACQMCIWVGTCWPRRNVWYIIKKWWLQSTGAPLVTLSKTLEFTRICPGPSPLVLLVPGRNNRLVVLSRPCIISLDGRAQGVIPTVVRSEPSFVPPTPFVATMAFLEYGDSIFDALQITLACPDLCLISLFLLSLCLQPVLVVASQIGRGV